jgi:heme/copper-type cytochrome/quinol oxidase subunit 2
VVQKNPFQKRWLRLLIIFSAVLLTLLVPFLAVNASPTERVFHIEASTFEYLPAEIQVNPGDTVTIELTSTDVVHGLTLDGYDVNLVSDPGQVSRVTFVADQAGVFNMRCSVACGNLHPFMIGKLRVGPNQLLARAIAVAVLALLGGYWSFTR